MIFNDIKEIDYTSTESYSEKIEKLKKELKTVDPVVIGAGLSASAGLIYTGDRFHKNFAGFEAKYNFHDMYSGGSYRYSTPEESWAYWSRYIYHNRYVDPPKSNYSDLLEIVKDKDYFVITTNVDH